MENHKREHVLERAPGPKVPVKNMKLIILKDVLQLSENSFLFPVTQSLPVIIRPLCSVLVADFRKCNVFGI
jgi:hypothetical protein